MLSQTQHSWNVKLSAKREKPRFVIIGFTLNGELITNNIIYNINLKVYLNSESYPYYNADFSKNSYSNLYERYTRFQSSYYNRESQPFLNQNEFKLKVPIIVVDLSKRISEPLMILLC